MAAPYHQALSALRNIASFNDAISQNEKLLAKEREKLPKLIATLTAEQQELLRANAKELGISI